MQDCAQSQSPALENQPANLPLEEAYRALEHRFQNQTAELALAQEMLHREITLTRKLEEQVRHSRKMEAIGTLAAGIAHDFNNLLTVVAGYTDYLLTHLDPAQPGREAVEQIRNAGTKAATLTRQLLAFGRQQVLESRVFCLNTVVADVEKILRRLLGEHIQVSLLLQPNLGNICADPGQLEQVIVNLAVNARDAMPQGGRLMLETSNVELDSTYAAAHLEVIPGRYVLLAVSDTGCGMDEATRERIFEPFFTTKAPGLGSGLGLSTVFGIVKQSGGHIWVYSEPQHGTTFKIYLPRVEQTASGPTTAPTPATILPPGTETILVVEDDAAVRKVTVLALRMKGYTVLEATRGREALHICESHTGPIDLLISDVIMPEMGGRKVAEAILAERPHIKVLYLSGYTDDAIVRSGILQDQVAFLQKPFTPESLGRKVREVLSRH